MNPEATGIGFTTSGEGWAARWEIVDDAIPQGTGQSRSAKVRNRHNGQTAFLKECVESASSLRLQRMRREAQVLAALRDVPGVPRLYEASNADIALPFIITEFIDGQRLNEAVVAGDVSSAEAVSIALALSDIVEALHTRDSYHRDIKPDNIMVTRESGTMVVHLVDYGSAYYEEDEFETLFGVELGNRFIRLPEFSSGSDPDSKRKPQSDLTMIAAVFFYALIRKKPDPIQDETGAHPHQRADYRAKLAAAGLNRDRLFRLFDIAFQLDIRRRFQSARALSDSLKSTLEQTVATDADMSVENLRDRLFTPTEATRLEARATRAVVLHAVRRVVSTFAQEFKGAVTPSQRGWEDRPNRQATFNDIGLTLVRDDRQNFVARAKAVTVGVETVVQLSAEGHESVSIRVPQSGFTAVHEEEVRRYFRRGLAALIKGLEVGDEEARRLAHEETKTRAFDMLTTMGQCLSYYLHQPARNKLEFSKQREKADVDDDGRYFSVSSHMTARTLNANGSIKFTYRARIEIPTTPSERDTDCLQEIVIESMWLHRPDTVASRTIRSGEDDTVPMRVSAEQIDNLVDECISELS